MDSILQEGLKDLFKEFEEIKNGNKKHSEFNALLQEELQFARTAEKSAESKKARCESFLNQQQDTIQSLLAVKEENANLKCKLKQMEMSLSMIQNNNIVEQMKNNAKIQELEQEHLGNILRIQEEADDKVEKGRLEYLDTINELKASISKLETQLEEKEAEVVSLQEKLQTLKEWSDANLETFHEKLAEQARKHQSELETWKMAELNRSLLEQGLHNNPATPYGPVQNQYQPSQLLRLEQGYQPNVGFQENSGYQKTALVTHYRNIAPRPNTNMVRPLSVSEHYQNKSDFIPASDLYKNIHPPECREGKDNENNVNKNKHNNKQKKRKLFSGDQNML